MRTALDERSVIGPGAARCSTDAVHLGRVGSDHEQERLACPDVLDPASAGDGRWDNRPATVLGGLPTTTAATDCSTERDGRRPRDVSRVPLARSDAPTRTARCVAARGRAPADTTDVFVRLNQHWCMWKEYCWLSLVPQFIGQSPWAPVLCKQGLAQPLILRDGCGHVQ